jgi:hypothetical protein
MEDKIQSLCARILAGNDDDKDLNLIVELRDALHQHVQRLRAKVAEYPAVGERRTREKQAEQSPDTQTTPTTLKHSSPENTASIPTVRIALAAPPESGGT